jgi:hypothetical protein
VALLPPVPNKSRNDALLALRPGLEIVAEYPSLILPFDDRELSRGGGVWRDARSGIDFFTLRAAEAVLEGDAIADGFK